MRPFTIVSGVAAPFLRDNVDTDALLPKQYLKTIVRSGLGAHLFHDLRYDENGNERADFVLNRGHYRHPTFLVTGANFGCGSSREHAPWALADFGLRAILAVSFADIFHGNCTKNGIVPIVLPQPVIVELTRALDGAPTLTVDLEAQTVSHEALGVHAFAMDRFRKSMLLRGIDDVAWTEERSARIARFEELQRGASPWLWRKHDEGRDS